MATKIFEEVDDLSKKPLRAPFGHSDVTEASKPGNPKLCWFNDDPEPSWSPYCVHLLDLTDRVLTFRFVKSNEGDGGDEVQYDCTVDLDARDDVWIEHPSTLDPNMPQGTPAAGSDYALLFFSEAYAKRTPAAELSGGTTSKWPRGAQYYPTFVRSVRQLMSFAGTRIHEILDAEDLKRLEAFLRAVPR